jgi:hypothetical protein
VVVGGFTVADQTKPRAVTAAPPSLVTLPPLDAEVVAIDVFVANW